MKKTITISIINGKGGSGKTTLSIAMATILSNVYRVLLVDLDPQCSSTVTLDKYNCGRDFARVIMGDEIGVNIVRAGNFDLLPASVKLANMGTEPETTLKRSLSEIRDQYDFIIIDSQGAVTNLMRMAIAAADKIVIPTRLNIVDYDTAVQTVEEIIKMDFTGAVGIVLNAVKDRTKPWTQEKIDTFRTDRKIGGYVLNTQIGEMVSLEKTLSVDGYKIPFAARVIIESLIREVLA